MVSKLIIPGLVNQLHSFKNKILPDLFIQQSQTDTAIAGRDWRSFIGSREWIGAIELSFVLDKLLGVNCKVINLRSVAELPEKCRERTFHFETQGTPIMIEVGVLLRILCWESITMM